MQVNVISHYRLKHSMSRLVLINILVDHFNPVIIIITSIWHFIILIAC